MAAQQFTVTFIPGKEGLKKDVAVTGSVADPGPNEVYVAYGSGVAERRGTEIINGLKWLENGVSERNLLDVNAAGGAFKGSDLVTCVDIDSITAADRRTSATLAGSSFAAGDLVIGMGDAVTLNGQVEMIRSALGDLRRAVQEFLYKNG